MGVEIDGKELPITFFAVILNMYEFPAISPVTVADKAVETESANVLQLLEPFTEYSTM